MASTVADLVVATLKASGVRRVYGIPGDSLNGFTDALRRDGAIDWQHVRHEEAAGFAAAAETALTGELAVSRPSTSTCTSIPNCPTRSTVPPAGSPSA
jgi:pyruvate dehydrogenase (quinone)